MDEDLMCIQSMTVTVSIATVIEKKGKRKVLQPDELEEAADTLRTELEELNFPEMLKGIGQHIAEEQFLKFHPVVDVSVDG